MNLRIADSAALVEYLHGVISTTGTAVLSVDGYRVVESAGRLFYHRADPITVGGPFSSLEELVRSEGVRRHHQPGDVPGDPPKVEVFEWAGRFFRINASSDEAVSVHDGLRAASGD